MNVDFIDRLFNGDEQAWQAFSDYSIVGILLVFAALIAVNVLAAVL